MPAYLDPISFQIVGDSLNLLLHKDLTGDFVLTAKNGGVPVNLSSYTSGQLILAPINSSCDNEVSPDIILFDTEEETLLLGGSAGTITLVVNEDVIGLATEGSYSYKTLLTSPAGVEQWFSGNFEVDGD